MAQSPASERPTTTPVPERIPSGIQPGPPPIKNFFGVMKLMRNLNSDMLNFMRRNRAQFGRIYRIEIMGQTQIITTDPDAMHAVLVTESKHFDKDNDYTDVKRGLARFLGSGLLTSNGDFWRRQRKLVAPALHAKRIEAYADAMVRYADEQVSTWSDGEQRDISLENNQITVRIVGKTLFNMEVEAEVELIRRSMQAVQERFSILSPFIPTWVPTPVELRARRASRDLDGFVYGMIADWREQGEDTGDLLSMLLLAETEDGERMTDKQARDEALTLFLAGHETTANALNWTFTLLAQHPDVEAKLHAEIDAVLGDRLPTLADLDALPYTEQVVKEAMRLYPPAPFVGRVAAVDVDLPTQTGETFHVPAGASLGLNIYLLHHDPDLWPDPDRFDPERFNADNEPHIPRYAYLPFGGGPRVCIGNSFAMMEARLILATVARRYRLSLAPGQVVEPLPLITLNPKGGLPMTLHAR